MDNTALFKIGYGLYVLTARDADKDNGCVVNTFLQITSVPKLIGTISVNKQNYTHNMIMKSKEFNVSVLTTDATFDLFKHFGFQSGASVDKFSDYGDVDRSKNGIVFLNKYCNAFLSCEVKDTIDFGTHTMFVVDIVDGEVIDSADSVTYAYYQKHIKPKPQAQQKKGYRCNICGYVYEGDPLPEDFICPWCKHGPSDFVKL